MRYTRLIAGAALLMLGANAAEAQGRGRGRGNDQGEHHGDDHGRGNAVSSAEQQRRIAEEQQRQADYQRRLSAQIAAANARTAQLQAQRRANAQVAAQQRYAQQLQAEQARSRAVHNYTTDPYVSSPPSYRYVYSGVSHTTNQYGVDQLRGAVNNGYSLGYQQGRADREDGASSNYRRSLAYADANYGYNGYVGLGDYNYYFRQGFQRGYSDGYGSRLQYGSLTNGNASILSNIISGILGLTSIR